MAREKKLFGYTKTTLSNMSYNDLKDLHYDIINEREGLSEMSKRGRQLDDLLLLVEEAVEEAWKNTDYQVWILGRNKDETVNDYEKLVASFPDKETAEWFVNNYKFQKPTQTPKAYVELEQVRTYPNGDETCEDIVEEFEIE